MNFFITVTILDLMNFLFENERDVYEKLIKEKEAIE
jgi:hypothetical protein